MGSEDGQPVARSRSVGSIVLAVTALLWLVGALGLGVQIAKEHLDNGTCEMTDSTDGELRWQALPPGSFCVVPVGRPATLAPAGWRRPPQYRSGVVLVLGVSAVVIYLALALPRFRVRGLT